MAVLRSQRNAPDNADGDPGLTAAESDSLQAAPRGLEEVPLELGTDNQLKDRWSPFSGIHDINGEYVPEQENPGPAPQEVKKLSFSDIISDLGESEADSDGGAEEALAHLMTIPKPSSAGLKITVPPLSKAMKSKQKKQQNTSTLARERKLSPQKAAQAAKAKLKASMASGKARASKANAGSLSKQLARSRKSSAEKPDFNAVISALSRSWDDSDDDEGDLPLSKHPKTVKSSTIQNVKVTVLTKWSVLAYVEIEMPPKTVQKTPRSQKKLEQQEPQFSGPITITHMTTWPELLDMIAEAALTSKENLVVSSLSWKFAPSADRRSHGPSAKTRLPMTSAVGYKAFVDEGVQGTRAACNFIFCMAKPRDPSPDGAHLSASALHPRATKKSNRLEPAAVLEDASDAGHESEPDDSNASDDDNGAKPKKGKGKAKPKASKKQTLDQSLLPITTKLKEKHPVGRCAVHPGVRCYFYGKKGWHFELDKNRLQVWAHAIDRGEDGVSYSKPPMGSIFFSEHHTLKVPRAMLEAQRNGHSNTSSSLQHPAASSYTAGPSTLPYTQGMMHPSSPMPPYPFYYHSMPPPPSYPMMTPMPVYPPPYGIPHGYQPPPSPFRPDGPFPNAAGPASDSD
ncbi:hypothetical protein ONZ51_g10148 [Trametes cubensis]|uniref:Uncharacterized protein n=1 Tax=Trametes cubensis TaxID=1111947 RepID=A0AAD7TK17_9APHY|nr:hypothetical protein ONZ51_g10148 [Trametes cubensis]